MIQSTNYHDYVIKDGQLIGEFEAMYQNSDSIPWHQDEQEDWIDVLLTKQLFFNKKYDEIHDFGAGLGFYLNILHKILGTSTTNCHGYDISSTACKDAKKQFPDYSFHQLDLMANPENKSPQEESSSLKKLYAIRGTLWYVFPNLENVVQNICFNMKKGDELLIVQNFPPLEDDFVGKETIPNYLAIERAFSTSFDSVKKIWYQDNELSKNDNWYIGIFKKK